MTPIEITGPTGKTAVVSQLPSSDNSVRYAMIGRNGGLSKSFKTLDGAINAANRYVGGCVTQAPIVSGLTTEAVRKMVRPWLTGDDAADAVMLQEMFRGARLSRDKWRQVVTEAKAV